MFDGSVVTRKFQDYQCFNGGKRQPCRTAALLFVDPSPAYDALNQASDRNFQGNIKP